MFTFESNRLIVVQKIFNFASNNSRRVEKIFSFVVVVVVVVYYLSKHQEVFDSNLHPQNYM